MDHGLLTLAASAAVASAAKPRAMLVLLMNIEDPVFELVRYWKSRNAGALELI